MIDNDELQDYRTELKKFGFIENDFELSFEDEPVPGNAIGPVRGTVSVKRKQNGIKRTYKSGHGMNWVVEFAADLGKKRFE